MLYVVFIIVMTINAFLNKSSTINVVAFKQEINTEYLVTKDQLIRRVEEGGEVVSVYKL